MEKKKGIYWKGGRIINVYCSAAESEAVQIAAENLCMDLKKVLGAEARLQGLDNPGETGTGRSAGFGSSAETGSGAGFGSSAETESGIEPGSIVVGTLGICPEAEAVRGRMEVLLATAETYNGGESGDGESATGTASKHLRKEGLFQSVCNGILYLTGVDRRGTIYAVYDFCQWLGVSPWYFWADVPVHHKDEVFLPEDFEKADYPSVEYRGIFINDEEELEHWVQLNMGEETIGVRTYEKVFELLLRLKGNYIWPAMHVNSFNVKKENGALAERMGIVVGTSHCDMLMRSNNREWKPWLEEKGYTGIEYDYSLEGRNREILQEYWRESVQQNKDFEVSYTLGMRGIHDSGFETRALAGLEGEELRQAKIDLLEKIIADQQKLLGEELAEEPLKIFVPYKEVMELYDNGLEIPEELTLIWANDNYGYIRRYPGEREKMRKGGNGIYYHNSYWAPPGASYLFICSVPLAHTRNELCKAYEEGIRKLWVMNVGAIKPLEQEIEFYLTYAWEIGKEKTTTEDVDAYLANWIDRNFTGGHGKAMAEVLNQFDQLTNVRKIEQMDTDTFSQNAYGDEAGYRMNRYSELYEKTNEIYGLLPEKEKDAFFQMFLLKLHAAYLTNGMYYYADRSALCNRQGKLAAAKKYVALCREYDDARRRLLHYYNKELAGGKWNGMVTPEDFPPPRTAMYPACVPPLQDTLAEQKKLSVSQQTEEKQRVAQDAPNVWNASAKAYQSGELIVNLWGEREYISLTDNGIPWLEIGDNTGNAEIQIEAPEWLILSWEGGKVDGEIRVLVDKKTESSEETIARKGKITITDRNSGCTISIPVSEADMEQQTLMQQEKNSCGIIALEGTDAAELADMEPDTLRYPLFRQGWKIIPRLGRDHGALVEAWQQNAKLTYSFITDAACAPLLELHRFPTLDSTGHIGIWVSVDGGEEILLETEANDEKRGTWKTNVRNNVDKLSLQLPMLPEGSHQLILRAWSKYFSFTRLTLYTEPRRENMLGFCPDYQELPPIVDTRRELFYGNIPLSPRPAICFPVKVAAEHRVNADNNLINADKMIPQEQYGNPISPAGLLEKGRTLPQEAEGKVKIDAATALAQSPYAYTTGSWDYCSSESYARTGLAMHIRKPGDIWKAGEESPALHYNFCCKEGTYTLWLLLKCNTIEDSHFTIGMDDTWIEEKEICAGRAIWRYSAEQVYRWVPLLQWKLDAGEHTLHIKALSSATRYDRIYFTTGEEFPPVDAEW